jgi:hypothetical protein
MNDAGGRGRRVGLNRWTVVMAVAALTAACATSADPSSGSSSTATTEGPTVEYVGSFSLDPPTGRPGDVVMVTGEGFAPDRAYTLTWGSWDGTWVIEGDAGEEYHGRQFTPTVVTLAQLTSDASGSVSTQFTVPEDFGFGHDVRLVDSDGVVRNQALFSVGMEVEVSPDSGPVGTPITIRVSGLGVDALEGNRQILYDDRYTGWLSAVTSKGTAVVEIPATGAPGPHRIDVARGAFTFPYLNPAQSPRPDILVYGAVFTVTDGDPVLPAALAAQNPEAVATSRSSSDTSVGPWLTTDYEAGPVGTPILLTGGGFASGASVEFTWYRIVGNRVAGQGWEERGIEFGSVIAGVDGTFSLPAEVPSDVGGGHRIEAAVDGTVLATASFRITPAADPIPESVAWGDPVDIHLTGVGWTETANIYTIVYDDAYLGYACGFNSQGDVLVPLAATGEPGWHFIDLYPAIYKGEESGGQQSFRIPMLNYAEHPGENLPAFHFAFRIEG